MFCRFYPSLFSPPPLSSFPFFSPVLPFQPPPPRTPPYPTLPLYFFCPPPPSPPHLWSHFLVTLFPTAPLRSPPRPHPPRPPSLPPRTAPAHTPIPFGDRITFSPPLLSCFLLVPHSAPVPLSVSRSPFFLYCSLSPFFFPAPPFFVLFFFFFFSLPTLRTVLHTPHFRVSALSP